MSEILTNAEASLGLAVVAHAVYARQPVANLFNHASGVWVGAIFVSPELDETPLTDEWRLSQSDITEAFEEYPLLKGLLLLKQNDIFMAEPPSFHILYRLLAAASSLRVATALKWQLAHLTKVRQGAAALNEAEQALRKLYPPGHTVYIRDALPFCGGDFSQR
jgi:hypothetical protein